MNYEPNMKKWEIGDIVIHDADPKNAGSLMRVLGYSKEGKARTEYLDLKRNDFPYCENDLRYLHDPARFEIQVPRNARPLKDGDTLYSVCCGSRLGGTYREGVALAIACLCGAAAPILTNNLDNDRPDDGWLMPHSLLSIHAMKKLIDQAVKSVGDMPFEVKPDVPHLEYYLGYSDFDCTSRRYIKAMLQDLGSGSQDTCDNPGCRQARRKHKEREMYWKRKGEEAIDTDVRGMFGDQLGQGR